MSRPIVRRVVGAVGAATLATLGVAVVGGGVASAASGSLTWDDGASRFTRTISNTTPNAGDVITSSTKFQRTNGIGEYIYTVSDYHPTCLTYVTGSAKMNGSTIGVDTVATDNTKVKGSSTQWPVGSLVNGTDRTFEFSYTVGADCARDTALSTWMNYTSSLGSGTYTNKGPTLTVAKGATTTTLAAVTGAKVGQSSQLTATVTGGAAGNTVEFYDGTTKIGQGALVGNSVSIGWTPTTAGAHSLSAKFLATGTAGESQSATQSVQVADVDVATTTSLQVPGTATTGQSVDLTATVSPAPTGGTVQFKDGDTNIGAPVAITGGVATLSHTFDAAGAKSITAVYSGAAGFLTSTSTVGSIAVSVPDVATATTLEVPGAATTGQAVELKATVAPAPSGGTVQFKDGDTNIGAPVAITGGVATLSHTFDAAGAKSITAVYSGAAGFLTSTSTAGAVTVTDPDAATTTSLVVPATATTGQSVELKATVSPAPSGGTVQFKDGDTNIGAPVAVTGGVATLSHAFDAAGGKSVTAVYSGVAGFLTSTSAVSSVTVSDPAPVDVATTTSLVVPGTATTGQSVELKATVSPAPSGGTVQFKDGDTNIGAPVAVTGGVATLSHTFDAAGGKSVTAVYSGVAGFLTSTSVASSVTVSDPAPADVATTVLASASATAKVGAAVELTATVTPSNAQGTVQFKEGDVNIGGPVAVADGIASFSHAFDAAGSKSITAVFVGGPGFLNSTSQPVTVIVSDPLPTDVVTTTTIVVPATTTVGQTVVLTASVAPATAGGTVQFMDGDRAIGLPAAIVDGKATLSYSFPTAGTKNITAVYAGGTGYTASTSEAGVVTVSAAPAQGGGSLENIFGS